MTRRWLRLACFFAALAANTATGSDAAESRGSPAVRFREDVVPRAGTAAGIAEEEEGPSGGGASGHYFMWSNLDYKNYDHTIAPVVNGVINSSQLIDIPTYGATYSNLPASHAVGTADGSGRVFVWSPFVVNGQVESRLYEAYGPNSGNTAVKRLALPANVSVLSTVFEDELHHGPSLLALICSGAAADVSVIRIDLKTFKFEPVVTSWTNLNKDNVFFISLDKRSHTLFALHRHVSDSAYHLSSVHLSGPKAGAVHDVKLDLSALGPSRPAGEAMGVNLLGAFNGSLFGLCCIETGDRGLHCNNTLCRVDPVKASVELIPTARAIPDTDFFFGVEPMQSFVDSSSGTFFAVSTALHVVGFDLREGRAGEIVANDPLVCDRETSTCASGLLGLWDNIACSN